MRAHDRKGFTLLELVAALSVIGVAMLGGMVLLDQLGDSAGRIARDGALAAREGNGARVLRRVLLDASSSPDSTKRFRGDEHSLELWSMCDVPGGWSESCHVVLAIDERGDSSVVLAELSGGQSLALRRQAGMGEFRYYSPSASDSVWVHHWSSNVTLPVAVGLLARDDTIVFPVGVGRE